MFYFSIWSKSNATQVFDVWQQADVIHPGEKAPEWVFFKFGFVRVRKPRYEILVEAWGEETEQKFYVPEVHLCEVCGGAQIKFVKA